MRMTKRIRLSIKNAMQIPDGSAWHFFMGNSKGSPLSRGFLAKDTTAP